MYISTVSFVEYTPAGEQRQRFVIGLGLFHGTEVLSLLLEPPADSISVYRPVKCTSTI